MKKSLLALAVLGSFAGGALAQSSVTLFGIVDLNARYVKNDGSDARKSLSSNGIASSRLGFRGVEDLGGGLKAGFWIEGALDPDTGNANGQTWQRRSTVSLMGGFGEVRLGRDYTPTFWNHTVFDPFGTNGLGSQNNLHTGGNPLGSGATTFVRANNTIGYFLPALGGIYGQLQVAAGEGVPGNKYIGGRIGYQAGPVNVAVAYGETDLDPAPDKLKAANIGASYDLGVVKLFGQYHQYKFGGIKQKNALLGVTAPVGPGTLKASYGIVKDFGEAQQLAVGYQYDLSKRTALYTNISYLKNKANQAVNYVLPGGGALTGRDSKGAEFGIRHTF